jgi:hypothetical protein
MEKKEKKEMMHDSFQKRRNHGAFLNNQKKRVQTNNRSTDPCEHA